MKIPFDIKHRDKIESGEYKVETRDGKPVRIICWDKKSEKKYGYHIVGLIEFGPQHEESTYYTIDGKGRLKDKEPELFIVTQEPEMNEWELAIAKYRPPTDSKETIQKIAAELLALAKQQLLQSGELLTQEHHEKLMETLREECKKELPRWRVGSIEGDRIVGLSLYHDSKWVPFSDLEKLPGFNDEDHE